ncbi:glycosyltransferase [Modestobacter sp. VKM Ac-2984]|uniref:glycosyltransferase n=1 Tax=Modestobacter sp. VKM Ac-2984 TaxID=3004138 RepID=UPI0022AACA28|nr:glycosyltransferase [Modestobacter sp. VKM Ac-2984]MCZ2817751.1 glycosyltransferase [Modestobacter sp. VKM Ac-2984]
MHAAETTTPAAGPIGIVVVNYGSHALLAENLDSAPELGPDVRVVVVDNHTTAAERRSLVELGRVRGWDVVGLPDNRGFGAATNVGVARARALGCVTFLCLNPDARATPAVVAELRAHSLREPLTVLSPLITSSAGELVFSGSTLSLRDGRIRGARSPRPPLPDGEPWLTGACLVVHAQLWDRLGGFDETYFLYWEDVDLSHRALAAGGRLEVRSDLRVVHDEGGTHGATRTRGKSALYYRYNCRNRLAFAARNLSRPDLLRWLAATPRVSWEVLLRGGRRQLVESPRPMWAALRGSVEGAVLALAALVRPVRRRPAGGHRGPRRVLLVHPGSELYGSDRVFLESVAALVATDQVVVALPGPGPLADALRELGAEVVTCRMPVVRKSALRPVGALALLGDAAAGLLPSVRLLRTAGRDGVYVSTLTIPLWVLLARLLGRRVVCHVHEAERGAPAPVRRLLTLPVTWASAVVVNSRFSLGVLAESAPRVAGRATVVHNGIPSPATVPPPRAELTGGVRLLYVGRLSARKGPQVAVAALEELRARGVPARLDLLGGVFPGYEWFEAELREAVSAAGLDGQVAFRGFEADVWPVLAAADVVLVPSVVDEPFGNTAVEAVLAARPLVVSDSSGLREAAAGYASARAVPPGRPAAWAEAVAELVADWPTVGRLAVEDAQLARARHAPETYRAEIARLLHHTWDAR